MKARHAGHSLSEYGIILGLIALLAIPALAYIGNINSGGLKNAEEAASKDSNLALIALKSGKNAPAASQQSAVTPPANAAKPLPSANISFNPQNGQVSFQGMSAAGSGAQTTSVEGTALLSQQLQQLSQQGVDGTPPSPQIQQEIQDVAAAGDAMAKAELAYNQNPNFGNLLLLYMATSAFTSDYQSMEGTLAKSGNPKLTAAVNNDAALIYQISNQNYFLPNTVGNSEYQSLYNQYVGPMDTVFPPPTAPISVSVQQSPPTTNQTAAAMQTAATTPISGSTPTSNPQATPSGG